MPADVANAYLDLLDYRRAVAALYADVRQPAEDPAAQCRQFRQRRDQLFRTHPQSPDVLGLEGGRRTRAC